MPDDDLPVGSQVGVEFQRGDAELQRVGEGRQGLLGPFAAASPVRLQVEGAVALVGLDAGCCLCGSGSPAFDDGAEPAWVCSGDGGARQSGDERGGGRGSQDCAHGDGSSLGSVAGAAPATRPP